MLVGRGWSKYDFAKMIAEHAHPRRDRTESLQRSRTLFYVVASRAKHNLALLFVQELNENALSVLTEWVGPENVISIPFDRSGLPVH